jgi:hypothetical protein
VVAAALKRAGWILAALVAGGVLFALALQGDRPGAGFSRYEPEGVMVRLAPERVSAVEVARGDRRWRFVRDERGGWKLAAGGAARSGADVSEPVAMGLRFLHGSAPQRVMAPEELTGTPLSELGLAPPRLVVSVYAESGAPPFVVELGAANPQGLARYARVAGRPEVLLLNRYVAEAWETAASP